MEEWIRKYKEASGQPNLTGTCLDSEKKKHHEKL
jgi:hypothetical protein